MSTSDGSSKNACAKENIPAHVKSVKQMFEKAKHDDSAAAPDGVREKRRMTMSSAIELLQKKIHPKEESDESRASKFIDLKQTKFQAARPKCTWTAGTLSGAARKRSRSRFPTATKKVAVSTGPANKKERPYRQWMGVSHCVTTDTKFIISSKPSRHRLEMDTLPLGKTQSMVKKQALKSSRNGSKSPESIIDNDLPKCAAARRVGASHCRTKSSEVDVCDEGANSARETPVIKGQDTETNEIESLKCIDDDELISHCHEISEVAPAPTDDNQRSDTLVENSSAADDPTILDDTSKESPLNSCAHSEKSKPSSIPHPILECTIATLVPSTDEAKSGTCTLHVSGADTQRGLVNHCEEGLSLDNPCGDRNRLTSADVDGEDKDFAQPPEAEHADSAASSQSLIKTEHDKDAGQREAALLSTNSYKGERNASFMENKELSFDRASSVDAGEVHLSDLSWQEFTDDDSQGSESCFRVNFNSAVKGRYQPGCTRMTWRTRADKSSSLKSTLYPKLEDGCRADFGAGKREQNRARLKATSVVAYVGQCTLTPPHSTAETSHIKGLSTPETKRKPSSISPLGAGLPGSKRPMLRTEARACQRSRQQSPCTNNADTTATIRWTPLCTPKAKQHIVCKMSEDVSTKTVCSIGTETDRGQMGELAMLPSNLSKISDNCGRKKSDSLRRAGNKIDSIHLPKNNKHKSVGARQLLQKINWTSKHDQKPDYILVQAIVDFRGTLPGQLSFRKGQIIRQRCEAETQASDLCYGSYSVGRLKKKRKGLFPAYCVAEINPAS